MYIVCYFGSDPNQDRDFRKISEQTPNINFRENLLGIESLWYLHSERHDRATSFFFTWEIAWKKKYQTPNPFSFFLSFSESKH